MNSSSENNKRIAKNTMFLYFRSLLTLGVGLYTSREVLAQLGVEDFGVYNVVGGVIVLFSFLQQAMSSATSRFFTFDLGKGDYEQLNKTFSLSVIIHVCTALIILILGETVGLWFLNTQLVIPVERMDAANFVYQFSVISACVGILQVPYSVAINAHERMKIYAYAGIADAVFKLAVAISLSFAPFDKLKFYAVMVFGVYFVMIIFYRVYCHRNFAETHFKWFWDRKMFVERMGFSGWNLLGNISAIAAFQGVNMLLNIFHGVVANAAYGIMMQVSNALSQFIGNISAAINPQITKSYAKNDFDYLHSLIFRSTKFMFLLVFAISVPLFLNMDFILHLWLKNVPPYAVFLCQGILIHNLINTLSIPINITIIATAKIKKLYIVAFILTMSDFIIIYILFSNNFSPKIIPIVYSIRSFVGVIYTFYLSKIYAEFPISKFMKNVVFRLILVSSLAVILPTYLSFYFKDLVALFATSISFILLFAICSVFWGLDKNERIMIFNFIKKKFC